MYGRSSIAIVGLPHGLSPLRGADFRRYFASSVINAIGSWASMVALSFGVLEQGTATALGLVFLAREIPIVVFVLAGGVWADRWSRRSILIGSNVLSCAAQAVTAAALLDGWGLGVVAAAQVVSGGATAFSRPATTGFIPELVPPEQLQQANALGNLSWSSVALIGASAGALLVAGVGAGWALALDASTYAVAAALIAGVGRTGSRVVHDTSPLADLTEGWRAFLSYPWVVAMVIGFGVYQLTLFPALEVLGPLTAKTHLGGASAWAEILIAGALGAIVGSVVALRVHPRRPLVTSMLASGVMAAELYLLGFATPVWTIALAAFCGSVGLSIADAVWFTALQGHIPGDQIGRISSFDWLGSIALNPIGYAFVGPLAAASSPEAVLIGSASLMAAATIGVLAIPSVRTLRPAQVVA
jgi:predicted MFS family arabinose efflux permease